MKQHNLVRGCLLRHPGAAYLVTNLDKYKTDFDVPWKAFVYDPIPLPMADLGVSMSPQELALVGAFDGRQAYDVWDWVGAGQHPKDKGYWYPADYIEEGVRYEFSTLVSKQFIKAHAAKLSTQSRLIKVHPHIPRNLDMWADRIVPCIQGHPEHEPGNSQLYMCASMYWECVSEGNKGSDRAVSRLFPPFEPMFSYRGYPPNIDPQYEPGPFMFLPLQGWEIIQAPDGAHKKAIELLGKSGNKLPFRVVEE